MLLHQPQQQLRLCKAGNALSLPLERCERFGTAEVAVAVVLMVVFLIGVSYTHELRKGAVFFDCIDDELVRWGARHTRRSRGHSWHCDTANIWFFFHHLFNCFKRNVAFRSIITNDHGVTTSHACGDLILLLEC